MSERKDLPSPSSSNFQARVRETLMAYLGRVGDPLDRGVTLRDLLDSGIAKLMPGRSLSSGSVSGVSLPIVPQVVEYEPNLTPPPTPTGFAVSAAISNIFVEHDAPTYTQGHGHLRTRVYGKIVQQGDPLPTFGDATEITQFTGRVHAHPSNPSTSWRLWIKWESNDGVLSVSPAGGTNGLAAGTSTIRGIDLGPLIVEAANLANGAVDRTKFANTIEPVSVVSSVPTTKSTNSIFNTTDGKLYRWNGSAYVATVPAADISGTLTAAQIASVAASQVTGQLSDSQLAAIAAAKLTGQIVGTQITDGAISTAKLAAGSVTAAVIAADTITASQIAASAITSSELAAGAVTAGKIAAGSIQAGDIAAGTITGDRLAANTITSSQIAANAITAGQIAAGAIGADQISAGAITATKLAANSIAVGTGAIQNGAIVNAMIGNAAIDGAKIADASITNAKIASLDASKITTGTLDANRIAANSITASQINGANLKITAGMGVQLGQDVVSAGHYGLSLSSSDFNNIFIKRSDGVVFFRVNEGGTNSLSFDSSSGQLLIRGQINGGAFTGWAWPASGQTGFHLGPNGLLIGNANDNKYFYVSVNGDISAPGLSISNGSATFSGTLSANIVNTNQIVGNAAAVGASVTSTAASASVTVNVPSGASAILIEYYLGPPTATYTGGSGKDGGGTFTYGPILTGLTDNGATTGAIIVSPGAGNHTITVSRGYYTGTMRLGAVVLKR